VVGCQLPDWGCKTRKDNMKRIKHNDLLPWFTQDHRTLPKSYLESCQRFFLELDRRVSDKRQASSDKQQALTNNNK
jgi:hypothetical protein